MKLPNKAKIDEAIKNTLGTTRGIEANLEDLGISIFDDLSREELLYIDSKCVICDICEWWFDIREEGTLEPHGFICGQCNEEKAKGR